MELINKFLENDTFLLFLTLVLAMLGGYTLNPMPRVLKNILDNSFLIKFLVLVLIGCKMAYPVDNRKLLKILVIAFLILYFVEFLRKYD